MASEQDEVDPLIKWSVTHNVYNDLRFYFKYASSAFSVTTCKNPNGNTLVLAFHNQKTETKGFVARDDSRKEIVVALRGSCSIQDAMTDMNIILVPFVSPGASPPEDTNVHRGFLTAWNSVATDIISVVGEQLSLKSGYSIVTTGHSLGGALSSLAAITLKMNFPEANTRMYTYGQPRTGNRTYATFINDQFGVDAFRVTHTFDGVPTMLPTILGYRHHGIEYWQYVEPPAAETTKRCCADGEDPTCSALIPSGGVNPPHTIYCGIVAGTPFCS